MCLGYVNWPTLKQEGVLFQFLQLAPSEIGGISGEMQYLFSSMFVYLFYSNNIR